MITRSELAIVCRRLESELQEVGLVFGDVEFDESGQTLCIVLRGEPNLQLSRLPKENRLIGTTIDAGVLWDLLQDLMRLGLTNPAIHLRHSC
jgi:hypothetical protein